MYCNNGAEQTSARLIDKLRWNAMLRPSTTVDTNGKLGQTEEDMMATVTGGDVRVVVREHYTKAAEAGGARSCCDDSCCEGDASAAVAHYDERERSGLPRAAVLASLGCGNPLAVAELREGETVLDLGSGGGIDVLLSARRVGPSGHAYGLDMTPAMLELARRNATEAGAANVTFLEGHIEAIPLPADSVDVVISNCVVNLSVDKPAVFAEMLRVLRPGGRIGITDVVAEDALSPGERAARGSHAGCIAGALSFREYREGLLGAGFAGVEIQPTHEVTDGLHSAIVRAAKPVSAS
jgi:SAM-dependent methyltransferase